MMNQRMASLTMAAGLVAAIAALPAAAQTMSPQPLSPPPTPLQMAPSQTMPPQTANVSPQLITNGPQESPGDNASTWSARRNVIESRQYEQLLRTNPGFRAARIRKECGPIDNPQLHQQCVASFD